LFCGTELRLAVYSVSKRIRIGYMRVKEVLGLVKFEFIPIDREKALKILRGEVVAGKTETEDKG